MFVESRHRSASRHQFRLFGDLRDELAARPMLFHPEYRDSSSPTATDPSTSGDLKTSFDMFSPTSPSPTRTMIKEANDHLQLLHHRVVELEKTVQEQAEALIKKDESMQSKIREVSDAKDAQIRELTQSLETCEQRIKKLEQQCREKDSQVEYLNQKYSVVDELNAYSPILERLVSTLKKLPKSSKNKHSRLNSRANSKPKTTTTSVEVDGHVPTQAMADLRIGRSFSINQNFSMSEDEGEEYS